MTTATIGVCGLCGASWTVPDDQLWNHNSPCPFCGSEQPAGAPGPAPAVVATTMAALPAGSTLGGVSQQNTITITVSQHVPPPAPSWPAVERRAAAPEINPPGASK